MRGSWASISKNRLILVAISILTFCTVWIGYGLLESAKYEQQAKDKIGKYTEYTRDKVTDACTESEKSEKIKCVNEAFEAKREYEYNQSDLVAQRQSALWAYIMAAAAVFGIALSAVGVWLVKTTFDETRKANEIAADTAKRQLRAYIHPERVVPLQHRDPITQSIWWSFYVVWKNSGITPATNAEMITWSEIVDGVLADDFKFDKIADDRALLSFGPNSSMDSARVTISDEEVRQIAARDKTLYLWGWVKYQDIFPESPERCAKFCYRLRVMGHPSIAVSDRNVVQWISNLHSAHNSST